MSEEERYRVEAVKRFAGLMEKMVIRKAHKGTWLYYTLAQALGELMAEVGEIGELAQKGPLTYEEEKQLQWECVDVAVSAMILADLCANRPSVFGIRYKQKGEGLQILGVSVSTEPYTIGT